MMCISGLLELHNWVFVFLCKKALDQEWFGAFLIFSFVYPKSTLLSLTYAKYLIICTACTTCIGYERNQGGAKYGRIIVS